MNQRFLYSLTILLLALVAGGCGDDGRTRPMGDGGGADARAEDETDGGTDSGSTIGAPYVAQTLPDDGDEDVDPGTSILVLFSEPMDPTAGTVGLEPGGVVFEATSGEWLSDADLGADTDDPHENVAVLLRPAAALTGGVEYTVTVRTDFEDAEGVALDEEHVFQFVTFDEQRPQAVSSSPAEGDTAVSATLTEISVTFSEEMNTALGTALLSGGPGRLGDPTWSGSTITWPVVGIEYESTYRLELLDFLDRAGNEWDPAPYLGDGALDFTTGPDTDAPVVAVSVPTEGMRGVNPALATVRVTFSEPMDTSVTTADLSDGTTTTTLTGTWSPSGTELTFAVAGLFDFSTDYTLDLGAAGFADPVGNALDGTVYLGDGLLDFSVGLDTFGPRVVESDPLEGEIDVDFALETVSVRFDEPMDPSVVTAPLSGDGGTVDLTGTWTASNTIIDFDVRGLMTAGVDYSLDVRGFEDATGNPVDATDAYLADGRLDFRTVDPSGDTCAEALTVDQAVRPRPGVLEWVIASADFADDGATDNCDDDSTGADDDVVIEYVKTSASLSEGGSLLSIRVASGSTSQVNFEVRAGSCDPVDGADPQLACHDDMLAGGATLDVGPGTYYVWVAKETSGSFPGATVTVEEVGGWPQGESCHAPFTTSSPSTVYIAPSSAGGEHIFQIRPELVSTYDRGRVTNSPSDISCSTDHGHDAVIRFDKMAGSLLEIRATPVDIRSSAADLNMEISVGCDPLGASYTSLSCESNFDRIREALVSAPAGPVYVWLSADQTDDPFPGATVSIREITVGPGESCGTAHPVTGPAASVTLDSTRNLGGGTCLASGSNITWFAYTPTEDIALFSADAAGPVILADQETGAPLSCLGDATRPAAALVRSGRTLCIGVPNDSGVATLNVSDRSYDGVRGLVTDLGITRALAADGSEKSWTADRWLATDASTIYLAQSADVFFAPKSGGARAVLASGVSSSNIGYVGITVGSDLFSFDETTSTSSTRLYQLWDGTSYPWSPSAWDAGSSYVGEDAYAVTHDGASFIVVTNTDSATETTHFYSIDPSAPSSAVLLGTNDQMEEVSGVAADATWLYLAGELRTASGDVDGVFRLRRDQLSDPTAAPELLFEASMPTTSGTAVEVDDTTAAGFLYVRQTAGRNLVHAVVDPAAAAPLYVGPIVALGTTGDYAMTYDATDGAIYLFETETDPVGRIVRVE